ncbi:DUF255 domain-containing protein [Cohnella laeviribosi]|uniref:DUF255 domain-containing protein n=1 Tax=Cohnella laeviribosi TaxID=380174 RepID=UPI0003A293D3
MERESFEDEEVARLLNESFVSIKVDREERPDIDHLYMAVCQAFTGSGGWPLTVVLTPDQQPFFAGTYFPNRRTMGRYGLMEILDRIREMWKENPDELIRSGRELEEALNRRQKAGIDAKWDDRFAHVTYETYANSFDSEYGGFGGAPKFPSPHNLLFLMAYSRRFGERKALDMALRTLDAMAMGGIRDHIGGGFARGRRGRGVAEGVSGAGGQNRAGRQGNGLRVPQLCLPGSRPYGRAIGRAA